MIRLRRLDQELSQPHGGTLVLYVEEIRWMDAKWKGTEKENLMNIIDFNL